MLKPVQFDIRSEWQLVAKIDEVAAILRDPMSITRWWSPVFMRGEMIGKDDGELVGLTARFFTKGLLPHTFQFTARIDELDDSGRMKIRTWGDFNGLCNIHLVEQDGKVLVQIRWRTSVKQPYIRILLRLLKPVFVANHRWAMRRGHEGLQMEVLRRRTNCADQRYTFKKPTFPHNLVALQRRFTWTRESGNRAVR